MWLLLAQATLRYTRHYPPTTVHAWVSAENIKEIISIHGCSSEIDLLCIDIDGMDYRIWKAIDVITPRIVVIEHQDFIGLKKALTVPYRPEFRHNDHRANRALDPN